MRLRRTSAFHLGPQQKGKLNWTWFVGTIITLSYPALFQVLHSRKDVAQTCDSLRNLTGNL